MSFEYAGPIVVYVLVENLFETGLATYYIDPMRIYK